MVDPTLDNWIQNHNIIAEAAKIIQLIRNSPPSRRVKGGSSNVTGKYPSRKMGQTIQFESHKVELAFIKEYEFDDNVIEYYDQPGPIKISYRNNTGRLVTTLTTPDFFVIRNDGTASWEECKTEQDLETLSHKSERFVRDADGIWRCLPGEQYASQFGLCFRVRSSNEINWIWQRNIDYLSDYIIDQDVSQETASFIKAIVACEPGITLSALIQYSDKYTPDDIFRLIAQKYLYVNLQTDPISEQQNTSVYIDVSSSQIKHPKHPELNSSEITVSPGEQVMWCNKLFLILNQGDNNIWLQDENTDLIKLCCKEFKQLIKDGHIKPFGPHTKTNAISELLQSMRPQSYIAANQKYATISPFLTGNCAEHPNSTIYSWISKYKKAEQIYGYGYLGLLDRKSERGNRLPKLPDESHKLMQSSIKEQYLNKTSPLPIRVYGHYLNLCQKAGVIAASFKTFTVKLKQLDTVTTESRRKGPRAAYQLEEFYWELDLTTPRHGERPFEIAHIDHTELDIELVDSKTGNNLGRPWLTLMTDSCSRRILAYVLSFESPSYRACMLAMRECVRRHNRLPQTLVADNGAEFRSIYYEQLIAFHKITKKNRPKAKARYGAVLERLFGTTNTQFIHALTGNTKIMRNVRQVSKSFNPKNLAAWTFAALRESIGEYFSEVYEQLDHPALGESPIKAFERGLANHGMRPTRFIRHDDAFIFSTLPSTPKGHAKVIRSRGIKINNMYYWHEALRNAVGLSVPVRYDPYDIASAYALIKGQWIHCRSQNYSILKGRSQKELAAITQELFKLHSNHNAKIAVNAQMVAAFITKTQETESELKLMRKAAEMRATATDAITHDNLNAEAAPERPDMDSKDFEIYDELVV